MNLNCFSFTLNKNPSHKKSNQSDSESGSESGFPHNPPKQLTKLSTLNSPSRPFSSAVFPSSSSSSSSSSSLNKNNSMTLFEKLMFNSANRSVVAELKLSSFKDSEIIEAIKTLYTTPDSLLDYDALMLAILTKAEVMKIFNYLCIFLVILISIFIFILFY